VGGGLAGLAAGSALASSGFGVTLLERRPYLGGRASSYEHPGTGEIVDNCQHVLFRVCTNLIEFYDRIGVTDQIRWFDEMTFIEPGGRTSVMKSSFLPAPLHTAPSFFRFSFLNAADKAAVARALVPLTLTDQPDTGQSFQHWLDERGQTPAAITRFWRPVLVSALSEELDLISVSAAAQVVRESMKSPAARQMGVPVIPLTDLYNAAGKYITEREGKVRLRAAVVGFRADLSHVTLTVAGREEPFDYVVFALPFDGLARILPETSAAQPLRNSLARFDTSPITGIHLWFDREISDLDHAVLLDRTIQWMFHKSRLQQRSSNGDGSYVELVVSSSKELVEKSKQEIVDLAVREVREFFPAAREANLVKATVIKELNATYSPRPGIDVERPRPETIWPRVFLAGDWTATGWPATMESAVRSGYLAAQSLARVAGQRDAVYLVPDLPATGFMRFLG
jgi:zeta-carotene desaturase